MIKKDKKKEFAKTEEIFLGWRDIANYLNVSVRTAQRYSSREKDPIPVKKVKDGNKVFIYKREIDEWLSRNEMLIKKWKRRNRNVKERETESELKSESKSKSKKNLFSHFSDKNLEKYSIFIVIFFIFCVSLYFFQNSKEKHNFPLNIKISAIHKKNIVIISVYNSFGEKLRSFNYKLYTPVFKNHLSRLFLKMDINRDGMEDLYIIDPRNRSVLLKFIQTESHEIKFDSKKSFDGEYGHWNGTLSSLWKVEGRDYERVAVLLNFGDLKVSNSSILLFDGRSFNSFYGVIEFNGVFTDLFVDDLNGNGDSEFYIGAKNNVGEEKIVFAVEANWRVKRKISLSDVDSLKLLRKSPDGFKVVCSRIDSLPDFFLNKISILPDFFPPYFLKEDEINGEKYILLGDGIFEGSDILSLNRVWGDSDTGQLLYLRVFPFGYMLKSNGSCWWNYDNVHYLLNGDFLSFLSSSDRSDCGIIKYWNGKNWVKNYCVVK